MADNNNQQLQIELKPEVAEGTYSNLRSRIIMAPEHAKRLLMALQDNVRKYEQQFGAIRLTQAQQEEGRTIAPFSIKQGEA